LGERSLESEYIDELEHLYKHNFWFRVKQRYLDLIIDQPMASILDVGSGAGGNMTSYINRGFKVAVIDKSKRAIDLCKEKGYECFQADLNEGTPNIEWQPDYIIALDVIEHLQNPIQVLSNLQKISNPHTQLIVTVPAYQFLFSEWDRALGHIKRYNRRTLYNEINKGGWQIHRLSYIHLLPLIPALVIRKVIKPIARRLRTAIKSNKEKFFNPHLILNQLLYYTYYPELLLFRCRISFPFGLSILAIATPKTEVVST